MNLESDDDVFLRGNLLNEARSNGTPLTPNGTRIWRYAGGGDWALPDSGRLLLRLYGTNQNYRQNFSSVATNTGDGEVDKYAAGADAAVGWSLAVGADL